MSRASQRLRAQFTGRYHLAILLVALAATASFAVSYRLTILDSHRSHALTLVNAQQTHSQRIAFLIKSIDITSDPLMVDRLQRELRATIDQMSSTHQVLTGRTPAHRDIERFLAPLTDIYFGGAAPFDQDVIRFVGRAAQLAAMDPFGALWLEAAPMRAEIVSAATDSMLQTHGLMVHVLKAKAEETVLLAQFVDVALWLSILTVLILITVLIFRPMTLEVSRSIERLEFARQAAQSAKADAQAANLAKSRFFKSASHEIRTPLNAILGLTEVLKERLGDTHATEINAISAAGDHLHLLLHNILDANRLADDRLSLNEEAATLTPIFDRIDRLATVLAERKGIACAVNIDQTLPRRVLIDATRLEQVFVNLIDNAVKFTSHGGVTITIGQEFGADDTPILRFEVADTGIGMSATQVAVIEEAGRTDQRGPGQEGLGIGLRISSAIVRRMSGEMVLTSEEGQGTSIAICIPLKEQSRRSEEPCNISEDKRRVLIVDDNLANRLVAEALVRSYGAEPTLAINGKEAVAEAAHQPFDVVLMDISMPVIDGYEAISHLRNQDGPNRATPVLAVTAHVDVQDVGDLHHQGFQGLLNKPVRRDVLFDALDHWCCRPSATSPAESVA